MKKHVLLIFVLTGLLFSCQEEIVLETVVEEELDLSSYCSYTVDGITYECDEMNSWGVGNPPVNPVDDKAHEDYDSLFFHTMTNLSKLGSGELNIIIGKKFAVEDLIHRFTVFYKLSDKDRKDFLTEGNFPFAWDFLRHTTHDGVALRISAVIDGKNEQLTTYSTSSPHYPTAVNPESHKESSFIITKLHHLPNGQIIVEAEFDALFFGRESLRATELTKKVKGKARFPVIWFD